MCYVSLPDYFFSFISSFCTADVIQEDLMESIKLLKNYGSKLTNQTESALQRCIQVRLSINFIVLSTGECNLLKKNRKKSPFTPLIFQRKKFVTDQIK